MNSERCRVEKRSYIYFIHMTSICLRSGNTVPAAWTSGDCRKQKTDVAEKFLGGCSTQVDAKDKVCCGAWQYIYIHVCIFRRDFLLWCMYTTFYIGWILYIILPPKRFAPNDNLRNRVPKIRPIHGTHYWVSSEIVLVVWIFQPSLGVNILFRDVMLLAIGI